MTMTEKQYVLPGIMYFIKFAVLVFVAIISIFFSEGMIQVLLNAFTFLITVVFDSVAAAYKSWNSLLNMFFKIIMLGLAIVVCLIFAACLLYMLYISTHENSGSIITPIIVFSIIVGCALISVVAEYILSKMEISRVSKQNKN